MISLMTANLGHCFIGMTNHRTNPLFTGDWVVLLLPYCIIIINATVSQGGRVTVLKYYVCYMSQLFCVLHVVSLVYILTERQFIVNSSNN